MKRDHSLLVVFLVINLIYITSFALPFAREPVLSRVFFGWQVFAEECVGLIEDRDLERTSYRLFFFFCPHVMLWIGIVCLWACRPHLAFAAGSISTGISGFVYYDSDWEWKSGAYLWTCSIMMLTVAGFVFAIQQWRKTRRLPMLGES